MAIFDEEECVVYSCFLNFVISEEPRVWMVQFIGNRTASVENEKTLICPLQMIRESASLRRMTCRTFFVSQMPLFPLVSTLDPSLKDTEKAE